MNTSWLVEQLTSLETDWDLNAQLASRLSAAHQPLVIFDASASLIYINPVAKQLHQTHPLINLREKRIECEKEETQDLIRQQIRSFLSEIPQDSNRLVIKHLCLSQPNGSPPLFLSLTKIQIKTIQRGLVIGEFCDPFSPILLNTEKLVALFQLTGSETTIAQELVKGLNIEQIAHCQNRSTNTIRSHLKSLFCKTNTHSQCELVRLLLALSR